METLLVILLTLTLCALFFTYMFTYMATGMWAHSLYFLHKNSKESLRYIFKPGVIIKSDDIDYHWGKTDFGDYKTRWRIINPETRNKTTFDIIMTIKGSIVKIHKSDLRYAEEYIKEGVDLTPFTK